MPSSNLLPLLPLLLNPSIAAGIPKLLADKTPYAYHENTPIRKRIFAFQETAAAGRPLLAKTCVPGALPNFNHVSRRPRGLKHT